MYLLVKGPFDRAHGLLCWADLLNGAKFDASYDRRSPLEFQVGIGRVIKGWDEALLDMQVGEKRLLKIPSNLACMLVAAPHVLAGPPPPCNAILQHTRACALLVP